MKRGNTKRKNDIVFILFSLVLGLLMGWLARDLTTGIPHAVIVNIGIWVFVSSLLSVYSPGASRAAVHVFIFFAGVIGAYYLHCVLLGETVSLKHLAYWLIFAVIGALIGFSCLAQPGSGMAGGAVLRRTDISAAGRGVSNLSQPFGVSAAGHRFCRRPVYFTCAG